MWESGPIFKSSNKFNGTLPINIGLWRKLKVFSISMNALSGALPSNIGAWTGLALFEVESNKLAGTVPTELSRWTSIRFATFFANRFGSSMPKIGSTFCPQSGIGIGLQTEDSGQAAFYS
jgi:hypothetical protein